MTFAPSWEEDLNSTQIIEYGNISVVKPTETLSSFTDKAPIVQKMAADIADRFDTDYKDCMIDITEYSSDTTVINFWEKQSFSSWATMMTFLSNNCSITGGVYDNNVSIRVYDIVNPNIPGISKIYGYNLLYQQLTGNSMSSRYSMNCLDNASVSWTQIPSWMEDLYDTGLGLCVSGLSYEASPTPERSIWLSRNVQKRYGLPPDGFSQSFSTNQGRRSWSWGSSDWVDVPTDSSWNNAATSGCKKVYCTFTTTAQDTWEFQDGDTTAYAWLKDKLFASNQSIVILYRMENAGLESNGAFLKPLGQDTFVLNWYNYDDYDLYATYITKHHTPKIRKITSSLGRDRYGDCVRLLKHHWWPSYMNKTLIDTSTVSVKFPDIRFYLKSKASKHISLLSRARIAGRQRHRDTPIKFEVV